jgi:hypothetical protein
MGNGLKERKKGRYGELDDLIYKIEHLLFFFLLTIKAALVACSKTSRTPSPVLAEHSYDKKEREFSVSCARRFISKDRQKERERERERERLTKYL